MDRNEWLHRYRVCWLERCPDITADRLGELTDVETWQVLSREYPECPERAVDAELEQAVDAHGLSQTSHR